MRVKTPLLYGLGIAFVGAVLTLVFHLLGFSTSAEKFGTFMIVGPLAGLAVLIVGIVMGTRRVRAERGGAAFTYGDAFMTGLIIAISSGIFGNLFQLVYFKFLNPDFVEVTIEWTRGLMERMGARDSDIERMVEDMRAKSTLTRQFINGLIFSVIGGVIISLITAAILKRPAADAPGELPPTLT
jgi:nitrate reductase gamma subunit